MGIYIIKRIDLFMLVKDIRLLKTLTIEGLQQK